MFYSQNKKKKLYGVVLLLLCAFVLVSGIGFGISKVEASNAYISNIKFYKSGNALYTQFFVNTSFTLVDPWGWGGGILLSVNPPSGYVGIVKPASCDFLANTDPDPTNCPLCHFTAGNTYTINWNGLRSIAGAGACWTYDYYVSKFGVPTASQFIKYDLPNINDAEKYYFTEYPTLTITYPFDYAEIAEAFNITGSYTLPAGSTFDKLEFFFGTADYSSYYSFYQNVEAPSGDVAVRITGLSAGDYILGAYFINSQDPRFDYYNTWLFYHIKIVVGIPPELPDGETPPFVFDILDPILYYTANSNYPTSTLLFDNLSGAVKPLILTIGNNLTFFSSRFEQDKARETGESMAGGVLIVRAYAGNLNTFFSDLPISQALFLYLLLLVVVAVFRIVKNLINLIKP